MLKKLEFFPIPLFASVMGVGALSLAWRKATAVWGVPEWPWKTLMWITVVLFIVVGLGYLGKAILYPKAVVEDLHHPVKLAFMPTITISFLILATIFAPVYPTVASVLWWIGTIGHMSAALYVINSWYSRPQITRNAITPAWLIPIVGNVIAPLAAKSVGNVEIAWCSFGIGLIFWLGLWPMLLTRLLVHDTPIPAKLLPSMAIFLAPPAIISLAWEALTGKINDAVGLSMYGLALFLSFFLVIQIPTLIKLPFGLPILAYTFPVAALATASVSMAGSTDAFVHELAAVVILIIATLMVITVVARVGYAAAKGVIFQPE